MKKDSPGFSLPLLFASTLAAITIIALLLLIQLLNAVQTKNAILRQQLVMSEMRIRSLENQREAELILRDHEIEQDKQHNGS